jgi:signal transduction histidine kinase
LNADLTTTQRALVKEQARLAAALNDLERSNAALDEFAHAASHDLKAPLRAIVDYAELIAAEAGASLPDEPRGYLDRILALSVKMRGMIDAVLEYARVGRASSSVELADSGLVLRDVLDFLAPPPEIRFELASAMPVFEMDRVPFEQVFRNLFSNAIKYRRADGAQVRVTVGDENTHWKFVVADNGPGIAASQHQRIWNLFHTSRPQQGTGIGLALVKRIVEAQGGQVFVESAPGEGARFIVAWPKRPRIEPRAA